MFKKKKKEEKIAWNDGKYRPYQASSVPPPGEPLRPPQEYNGLWCFSFPDSFVRLFFDVEFPMCVAQVFRCTTSGLR